MRDISLSKLLCVQDSQFYCCHLMFEKNINFIQIQNLLYFLKIVIFRGKVHIHIKDICMYLMVMLY